MNPRRYLLLFLVYILLVFSPFMLPGLNQIQPRFLSMSLTFWYINLIIALGGGLLYWASVTLGWSTFDDTDENGNDITGKQKPADHAQTTGGVKP